MKNHHKLLVSLIFFVFSFQSATGFFTFIPLAHATAAETGKASAPANQAAANAKNAANLSAILGNSIIGLVPGSKFITNDNTLGLKIPLPFYNEKESSAQEKFIYEKLLPKISDKALKTYILNRGLSDFQRYKNTLKAAEKSSSSGLNKLFSGTKWADKLTEPLFNAGAASSIADSPTAANIIGKIAKTDSAADLLGKVAKGAEKGGKVLGYLDVAIKGYSTVSDTVKAAKKYDPNNPAEVTKHDVAKYGAIYSGVGTAVAGLGLVGGPVGVGFTIGSLAVDGITSLMGGKGGFCESMARFGSNEAMYKENLRADKFIRYLTSPEGMKGELEMSSKDLAEFKALAAKVKPPSALLKQLVYMREFYYRALQVTAGGGNLDDAAISKLLAELKKDQEFLDRQVDASMKIAENNGIDINLKSSLKLTDLDIEGKKHEERMKSQLSALEEKYNNTRNHVGPWGETKFADTAFGKSMSGLKNKISERKKEYIDLQKKVVEMTESLKEKVEQLKEKKAAYSGEKDPAKAASAAAELQALSGEVNQLNNDINKAKKEAQKKKEFADRLTRDFEKSVSSYPGGGNALIYINI